MLAGVAIPVIMTSLLCRDVIEVQVTEYHLQEYNNKNEKMWTCFKVVCDWLQSVACQVP